METKKLLSFDFFKLTTKHPIISVTVLCLLLIPFGFGQIDNFTTGSLIYGLILAVLASFLFSFSDSVFNNKVNSIICFALSSLIFVGVTLYSIFDGFSSVLMYIVIFFIACFIAIMMQLSNTISINRLIMLMVFTGIFLRLIYVLTTDVSSRQHDVWYFGSGTGHAGYIEYWYTNGLKLPDFDVTTLWQFYHPPLHHMLMALLLKLLTSLNVNYDVACDALQMLPLLYSSLCMVISYKIFKELNLKKLGLLIGMMVICFHPTFIIYAGSYNNDILSVLFIFLAILFSLKWYKNRTTKNIIFIALSVGLGMMTKLSVWMIAPAIAFLFLYVFFKEKKWKKYIIQFIVFIVICAPLALWWQTRNLITHNIPLTYVPSLEVTDSQYVGNIPFISRLFDFSLINYVFAGFPYYGAPSFETNPTLGLFKTAIFDEGTNAINSTTYPQLEILGPIIFWVSVILFVYATVLFFISMFNKKSNIGIIQRIFFVFAFLTFLIFYYYFCYSYPFSCTMNIRYCIPLILFCMIGTAAFIENIKKENLKKIFSTITFSISFIFSMLSMVMFIMIS